MVGSNYIIKNKSFNVFGIKGGLFMFLLVLVVSFGTIAQTHKGKVLHVKNRKNTNTQVRVKLYIQGYYRKHGEMLPALYNQGKKTDIHVTDTIQVIVHANRYPYKVLESCQAILTVNGYAKCHFKRVKRSGYISIRSRNALETWSSHPVNMNRTSVLFDFTTNSEKAFGQNMIEAEKGVWAFFSGDINQDGFIDEYDYSILEKAIKDYAFGWVRTDVNGDGNVDLLDRNIIDEGFIYKNKRPGDTSKDMEILDQHPNKRMHVKRPMR